jgi:hypothetical protein
MNSILRNWPASNAHNGFRVAQAYSHGKFALPLAK